MEFFPRSHRAQNAAVSKLIPSSNDQLCLCVRDFIKAVLNVKHRGEVLPPPPTPEEEILLATITASEILSSEDDFGVETEDSNLYGGKRAIPGKFKELCQKELQKIGVSRPTFNWNARQNTPWDNTVLTIIVKHWLHAQREGAFSHYPIQTRYCNFDCMSAIADRWVRGQKYKIGRTRAKSGDVNSRIKRRVSHLC